MQLPPQHPISRTFFVTLLMAFEECWYQKEIEQHHEKSHRLPLTMEKSDSYGILKEQRWTESLPTQHTGSKNLLDSHRTREQGAEQPIAGHHRRRALPCADTKDIQGNMQPPRQLPRLERSARQVFLLQGCLQTSGGGWHLQGTPPACFQRIWETASAR